MNQQLAMNLYRRARMPGLGSYPPPDGTPLPGAPGCFFDAGQGQYVCDDGTTIYDDTDYAPESTSQPPAPGTAVWSPVAGGPYPGPLPPTNDQPRNPIAWLTLNNAIKAISNIFSPAATSVAQAQAPRPTGGGYGGGGRYPVYRNGALIGYSDTPGGQVASGVKGALDQVGNVFGISSTTVIILGGLGLFLLYRPSPSRR